MLVLARASAADASPFCTAVLALHSAGLCPIPCDDKTPAVKWKGLRQRHSAGTLAKWSGQHGHKNIGILTGKLSGVFVVDIDDAALLEKMLERYGDTPLITTTPRGGFHSWYRHNGERCGTLRGDDLDVDLKGDGGFIVVPPSIRVEGDQAGKPYGFHCGTWDDIARLNISRPVARQPIAPKTKADLIPIGRRNISLRDHLLRQAPHVDDEATLLDLAESFVADNCDDPGGLIPVTPAEIRGTVGWVWKTQTSGRNFPATGGGVVVPRSQLSLLVPNPDALSFWMMLQMAHGARDARGECFAVVCKAMAEEQTIAGWGDWRRYDKALKKLIELGLLECVYHGGSRPGDPSQYRFAKGTKYVPNVSYIPPLPVCMRSDERGDEDAVAQSDSAPAKIISFKTRRSRAKSASQ